MKRLLMTLLAALAAFAVSAADVVWTGAAGDGLWKTAGNWQGGKVPGSNGPALFDLSEPASVSLDTATKTFLGLTVSKGILYLTADGASGAFNCSSVTTEVHVASGASLFSANNWYDSTTYSKTLLVTGTGKAVFKGVIGRASSDKPFKAVVFRDGNPEVATVKASETVVGKGVCLDISAGGWIGTGQTIKGDGSTLRFLVEDTPQTFNWPNNASGASWKLKVGADGVKVEGLVEQTLALETYRQLNWYATAQTADGIETDGGIEFSWPGVLLFYRPQSVGGPVAINDGFVSLYEASFTGVDGAVFGTNDLFLGNCWLQVNPTANMGLKLASGHGAKLRYGRSATICVNRSGSNVPQTITIGSPDAESSPLERAGKGGVLVVSTAKSNQEQSIDGQGGKVLVNGGVETHANGLVKDPIFAYSKYSSGEYSYFYTFMKYDDSLGLVSCTDLYTAGLDGGANSIANLDSGVEEYSIAANDEKSVLAVVATGRNGAGTPLSFGAGATLNVGNGVDPACVILNSNDGYGNANFDGTSGKIDFGTSEGVFAISTATSTGTGANIEPVIAGSGGVTFSGVFGMFSTSQYSDCIISLVTLKGANTYSGGTWINSVQVRPTKATAFGTGTVDVGAGMGCGGQIRFGTSGLNFANDFVIRGHGVKQHGNGATVVDNGALWFAASTEISGNVAIDRFARVSTTNAAASARIVLSGVVSGGKLKVRNGLAPVVLSNSNTYTGGTEVVSAALTVTKGDSLGTGDVHLDGGILRFENAEDVTFTNSVSGVGSIVIAGKGTVTFTDPAFAALPPMPLIRGSEFPFPNVADGTFRTKKGLVVVVQ